MSESVLARPSESVLTLSRVFSAPPGRVFRAWTEPELLKKWFGPETLTVPEAEVDLRVGGAWRIAMQDPEGKVYRVSGTYREIEPPRRLAFTWRFEHDPGEPTLVVIDFNAHGDGTELVMTHERFPNIEERDHHAQGWVSTFNDLARFLAE